MLVGSVAFLAGFVQGLTGFGSALVAMPLLLLFLPAKTATPFCILMGLVITSILSMGLKSHLDWKKIGPIFLGCLPGITCGTYLLKHANDLVIKRLLGIVLISYSIFCMYAHLKPKRLHLSWGVLAGFLTGVTGAAFSAGGPPTIIYTSLNDWNKDAIKATLSGFFLLTSVLTTIAHALAGIITKEVLGLFLWSIPSMILGTMIGASVYKRLSHGDYLKTIYVLLMFMGIMLLGA